jgi:hypothetical protein
MRIHRLIPILVVLTVLALTTTTIKHSPIAVESGTAVAQKAVDGETEEEPTEAEGVSTFPQTETKEERDYDLYLDAAEVERRAAEEQSGDRASTSIRGVPLSFKHVALPVVGGLDHAVAGVSTRNSGHGVIRLRGVPIGSQLILALLVWGEIAAQPPQVVYPVGFGPVCNPVTFQGFLYGTATQPCWNTAGTYTGYIANVTPAISGGINGDYQVKGLNSFLANNSSPWKDGAIPATNNIQLPLSEGASLIVFYTHPLIPQNAQLYINLGPTMFSNGVHTVTHGLSPIPPNLQTAKHSRIGADGQVARSSGAQPPFVFDPAAGLRSLPQISDERTWINALQIKGDFGGRNRDSDWNGDDGEPLNKLWDSHTDAFERTILAPPSYNVVYLSQGDCIVWAAHILTIK